MRYISLLLLLVGCLPLITHVQVQAIGNQAYGRNGSGLGNATTSSHNTFQLVDTAMTISGTVLLHMPADRYVVQVELMEQAETLAAANQHINQRIKNLRQALTKLSIREQDMYVEFDRLLRVTDNFSVYLPKTQYQSYDEAHEVSKMKTHYNSSYIKQELHKNKKHYYAWGQNPTLADRVIDDAMPVVGIHDSLPLKVYTSSDEVWANLVYLCHGLRA